MYFIFHTYSTDTRYQKNVLCGVCVCVCGTWNIFEIAYRTVVILYETIEKSNVDMNRWIPIRNVQCAYNTNSFWTEIKFENGQIVILVFLKSCNTYNVRCIRIEKPIYCLEYEQLAQCEQSSNRIQKLFLIFKLKSVVKLKIFHLALLCSNLC